MVSICTVPPLCQNVWEILYSTVCSQYWSDWHQNTLDRRQIAFSTKSWLAASSESQYWRSYSNRGKRGRNLIYKATFPPFWITSSILTFRPSRQQVKCSYCDLLSIGGFWTRIWSVFTEIHDFEIFPYIFECVTLYAKCMGQSCIPLSGANTGRIDL